MKESQEFAYEVYKNYVGCAKTEEERSSRIREFRCGGLL
jgi:hypothetical protein